MLIIHLYIIYLYEIIYIDIDHHRWRFQTFERLMWLPQRPAVELWLSWDSCFFSFVAWHKLYHPHRFFLPSRFLFSQPSGTDIASCRKAVNPRPAHQSSSWLPRWAHQCSPVSLIAFKTISRLYTKDVALDCFKSEI